MKYIYQLMLLAGISLLSVIPVFSQSTDYFPPRNNWEEKNPDELGLQSKALEKAVKYAEDNEYSGSKDLKIAILKGFEREPYHYLAGPVRDRGNPAGLIIKNGYIVAKWGDVNRVDMTFSVTKSYLSTVAGLAYDRGLIESAADQVNKYVWDGTFDGKHNQKVTWDHLLTQSSDWSGELFGMKDWADRPPSEGDIVDWQARKLHEPGTKFEYNDVRVNVLAYSLLQVWRKPLPTVLKSELMDKIQASGSWRWYGYDHAWVNVDGYKVQSVTGGGHSGGGIFINTMDHARFGLLFLNKGKWNNEQIISSEWIDLATRSSVANERYGYMWWLNKGKNKWKGFSEEVYYAAGFGGNFIVIDEEHDLVVVTRWLEPSKIKEFMELVGKAMQ
ncbi:MAG: serine hydrolase [Cyclobacteriaceae bacterium]